MKLEFLTPCRCQFELYSQIVYTDLGFSLPQWAPFEFTTCLVAMKVMAILSIIKRN